MKRFVITAFAALMGLAGTANAATYIEDFEEPFASWETDWLGVNSDLQNLYFVNGTPITYRGNNPDGLWIADGDGFTSGDKYSVINFNSSFGATITSLSLDVAGWAPMLLQVYDMSNTLIYNAPVALTYGAHTDPGIYSHYSISSSNGISSFAFLSTGIYAVEGYTSIDNVVVNTSPVPEPSTLLLLGSGLGGFAMLRRFRKG